MPRGRASDEVMLSRENEFKARGNDDDDLKDLVQAAHLSFHLVYR